MRYYKEKDGKITEIVDTTDTEWAEREGYRNDREVVQVHDGSFKFVDETTEDDFKPTQEEINAREIERLKAELSATDYKCLKYVDGALSESEYAEVKAYRAELRQRINELQRTE